MSKSPFYTEEHDILRTTVRKFVEKEISPYVNEWDEAGGFPRELYKKAAEVGLLGTDFPEQYGGSDLHDPFSHLVMTEELTRCGSGGVLASLMSYGIGLPPILALGNDSQKEKFIPPVLSGDNISALAITEPSGGSDVAQIKTHAKKEGEYYVVNGSKTFITSGMRADIYTVAVRTGGPGMGGISLLVIDRDTPGFTRTSLKKMGW